MFGIVLFIYSLMVDMAKEDLRLELAIEGAAVQPAAAQSAKSAQDEAAVSLISAMD